MTRKKTVLVATPHSRNDETVRRLEQRLADYDVVRVRSREELSASLCAGLKPYFVFFPHWSWRIERDVYSNYECVIFHMTDLPYGRGGSPLQNLIVRGHRDTKVTALRCIEDLDAGPVYLKRPLSLEGTAEAILRRASAIVEEMIVDIVTTRPRPQPQEGTPTVFKRRRPEDGNIATLDSVGQVYDYIRMLDAEGYPPAFIDNGHVRFEFSEAEWTGECLRAKVHIMTSSK